MADDEQQAPRPRKPHEDRAIRVLGTLLGADGNHEFSVPRVAARIDAVWNVGRLAGALGPLDPLLENRTVGVELYSGVIPIGGIADACFKGSWLAKAWARKPRAARHGSRPPLMLVVSNRRLPRRLRVSLSDRIAPGIWRAGIGGELEVVFVELAAVPIENGTTGLHMLRRPSDHEGARVLEAFLGDPTVDPTLRARIEEEIMSGTIPTTNTEHMTVAERVRAEGIAIGEKRGEKRGERRGQRRDREVLLAQARTLLGDEIADSLADIRDFETLCARAFAALAERR